VTRIELRFVGGAVVGGVARQAVPLGSTVQLVVSSDVADEVHLHGYDRKVDVPAGGTATLSLVANVPGVFDVELESRSTPLTAARGPLARGDFATFRRRPAGRTLDCSGIEPIEVAFRCW
jgi:hypothetical protein